jgi:integrase
MKTTPSRKSSENDWKPKRMQISGQLLTVYVRETSEANSAMRVKVGRAAVTIYRRKTPQGNFAFMVSNYAGNKRRFDSYATETDALEAAHRLARHLSERDVLSASMTREQSVDFASALQTLQPLGVSLTTAISTLSEAIKLVGDLSSVVAAAKFYAARHKRTTAKPLKDVVAEFLTLQKSRGAAPIYIQDLRVRLNRFAADCCKDCCNVTTAEIQEWLDKQKFSSQGYTDYRRRLSTLFKFAVARAYASDNPVEGVEKIKVRRGETGIFTPVEIARLLEAAGENFPDFLPCLALGAFAGLRSAEIERLEWSDIHLAEKFIVVGAGKAKTASRRIVPVSDNLVAWLAPYAAKQGKIWTGTHEGFYDAESETAKATAIASDVEKGVKEQKAVVWKSNGLRHSYVSYRFAQIGDAGRVAGECGNSAAIIHRHYRELVKPSDAVKWFAVKPETAANVTSLATVAA